MNVNTIITLIIYVIFFLSIITGALIGIKRGLKQSAVRFGILVIFLLIAGFITPPISKALLTIDLSSLNLQINGEVLTTIPEFFKSLLFSIEGMSSAAESMPSLISFIEGLPVALMNIIVFMILVSVMNFISWIVFIIIEKTVLKESKREKQLKKQRKAEKKSLKNKTLEQQVINKSQTLKSQPAPLPKKRRAWGGLVGAIQGFVLLFLTLLPITSLVGTFSEIAQQGPEINNLSIYAEEEENLFLSEYSSDLIKNILGDEVVSYFTTFSNSIPAKILAVGGFNNVIFDALTSVKVGDQNISIRADAVTATKIYDKYIEIMDELEADYAWADIDFSKIQEVVDMAFSTGIVKAFAEEGVPYAAEILYDSDTFTELPYFIEIKEGIDLLILEYKEDSSPFIKVFKKDVDSLLSLTKVIFKSGIFDQVIEDSFEYQSVSDILYENDYAVLKELSDELLNSYLSRIAFSRGLNIGLSIGSESLSTDTDVDLGQTHYESINWESLKTDFFEFLKTFLDIYKVLEPYDLDSIISDVKNASDINANDLKEIFSLIGKQLDWIKNSVLFKPELSNPLKGIIEWASHSFPDYIDKSAMLALSSWQSELENLSGSFKGLKESGILEDLLSEGEINIDILIEKLLNSSPNSSETTYIKDILNPIISSSITKKIFIYGLNQLTLSISDDETGFVLTSFTVEDLTADQNEDILNIAESILDCYSIFNEGLNIEDLDEESISKIAGLLTALQKNAFLIGKGSGFEKMNSDVNLVDKKVNGGGMFSNYYISFISYIAGDNTSINYKSINWTSFFSSLSNLSSTFNNIGDNLEEILDNISNADDLADLLNSLGLDGDIIHDVTTVQETIEDLENGDITIEDAFAIINDALSDILASTDEEGNSTIDSIIQMIETTTGENISENISSEIIADEQVVSNRINFMINNYGPSNPLDCTSSDLDPFNTEQENIDGVTVLQATISDLTCGATYILTQAVNNNVKIYITNIDSASLEQIINDATEDIEVRSLVLQVFEII